METQKKQHCKSYKERQREAVCFLPSPNNYKSLKFQDTNYQRFFLMKNSNTRERDRQTDRQKKSLLTGWNGIGSLLLKRKMVILCSDDEFIAAICWFNDRSSSSRQTDRQTEEGRKRRFLTTTPLKYLYSSQVLLSLSLSLSLSSPQKHKKNKRSKRK
jgi:hypothetical protein